MEAAMAMASNQQIESMLIPYMKELQEGSWTGVGDIPGEVDPSASDSTGVDGCSSQDLLGGDDGGDVGKDASSRLAGVQNGGCSKGGAPGLKTVDGRNLLTRRHQTAAASKRYRQKRKEEREEMQAVVNSLHNRVRSLESENQELAQAKERANALEEQNQLLLAEMQRLNQHLGGLKMTPGEGGGVAGPGAGPAGAASMGAPETLASAGASCPVQPPQVGQSKEDVELQAQTLRHEYEEKIRGLRQTLCSGMSIEEFNQRLISGHMPEVTGEVEALVGAACDVCMRYKMCEEPEMNAMVTATMADQMHRFGYCGSRDDSDPAHSTIPQVLQMNPGQVERVSHLRMMYMDEVGKLYLERATINPKLLALVTAEGGQVDSVMATTQQQLRMCAVLDELRANLRQEACVRNALICNVMKLLSPAQKGIMMLNAYPGTIDVVGIANTISMAGVGRGSSSHTHSPMVSHHAGSPMSGGHASPLNAGSPAIAMGDMPISTGGMGMY